MGSSYTAHKLKTWNQFVLVVATPVPFFMWNCLIYFLINTRKYVFNKKYISRKGKYLWEIPEDLAGAGICGSLAAPAPVAAPSAVLSPSFGLKIDEAAAVSFAQLGQWRRAGERGERRARTNCRHLFLGPLAWGPFWRGQWACEWGDVKKTFL